MPGVLILEALAQAAGLLAFDAMGQVPDENNIYYFVGIDGARFKRPWSPVISCTWRSRSIACAPVSGSSRAWPAWATKWLAKPS
jgi:3-hydroxymyristoyl/3-hydroxydecanoyl-(acyl carrier protein) dehydratase